MSGTRAAIRYAKAVLSLAIDQKSEKTVNDDMKLIAKTISEHTDLDLALKNAIAKQDTKKEILNQVFTDLNPLTSKLFDVLVDNNRIDAVADVALKYNELYEAHIGKEKATVTTAVPMTEDLEIKVMAKIKELTSKSVELQNIVDENIIGGFILRVGDIQYNASIASKLNKLKREFTLN
ncbi:ATP synthase F1 subunit delta [Psychroserpens mesophilus]|uniref:ATP synthase F1 subunit delta n=1 Tax=Psychroserpens mesophilus TaxID=325473 RepID=UPI003D653CA7